jgi:hypothetical protein
MPDGDDESIAKLPGAQQVKALNAKKSKGKAPYWRLLTVELDVDNDMAILRCVLCESGRSESAALQGLPNLTSRTAG